MIYKTFTITNIQLEKNPLTVKHYHSNIHSALEKARKTGLISINPSDDCKLAKAEEFIPKIYSKEELSKLLEKIKGSKFEIPVMLIAILGVRRSEALGINGIELILMKEQLLLHTL